MITTTRFLSVKELKLVFDRNELPEDLEKQGVVGVFETAECARIIENFKIENKLLSEMHASLSNVEKMHEEGKGWLIDLEAHKISELLLEESFVAAYCSKAGNPYDLSKRISLFIKEDITYWTENVYSEAFED